MSIAKVMQSLIKIVVYIFGYLSLIFLIFIGLNSLLELPLLVGVNLVLVIIAGSFLVARVLWLGWDTKNALSLIGKDISVSSLLRKIQSFLTSIYTIFSLFIIPLFSAAGLGTVLFFIIGSFALDYSLLSLWNLCLGTLGIGLTVLMLVAVLCLALHLILKIQEYKAETLEAVQLLGSEENLDRQFQDAVNEEGAQNTKDVSNSVSSSSELDLKKDVQELKEKLAYIAQENMALAHEKNMLEKSLEEKKQKIFLLEKQMEEKEAQYKKDLSVEQDKHGQVKNILKSKEKKITELTREVEMLKAEIDKTKRAKDVKNEASSKNEDVVSSSKKSNLPLTSHSMLVSERFAANKGETTVNSTQSDTSMLIFGVLSKCNNGKNGN